MRKDYINYTIQISKQGRVTLRTPAGRAVAWFHCTPEEAREQLKIYKGATLDDRRRAA